MQDLNTRRILFQGPSKNGLYPLPPSSHQHACPVILLGVRVNSTLWHARLGHPSFLIFRHLVSNNKLPLSGKISDSVCHSCPLGKSHKLPFALSDSRSTHPLELVHSDVWQSPILSYSGFRYFVIFVDDYSRYTWIFPLKLKSDVFNIFVKFKQLVENMLSTSIKSFQTDGGGEYLNKQFTAYLSTHGIFHRFSCPHHPEQNGLAERKHRHIVETGLTMLAHASMPLSYWAETFHTSVYLINRLPSHVLGFVSPYQCLFNRAPNYEFLKTFGCVCFPYLRPYNQNKLQLRSTKCVFLGYALNQHGYRCLDVSSGRVFLSKHVVFDELAFPFKDDDTLRATDPPVSMSDLPLYLDDPLHLPQASPSDVPHVAHNTSSHPVPSTLPEPNTSNTDHETSSSHIPHPAHATPADPHLPPHSNALSHTIQPTTSPQFSPPPAPALSQPETSYSSSMPTFLATPPSVSAPSSRVVTRAMNNIRKPNPKYALVTSTTDLSIEPSCFSQAQKFPEWRQAMADEFNALQRTGTWTLIPYHSSMNVLPNKWVFRIKRRADGSVERYKARLVANGFHQHEGIDYGETFSPVVNHSTIRLVIALAVQFNWSIRQLDVQKAFLHGSLQEVVYMRQPSGFVDPQKPDHVCRLNKSLYGLKQAPRAWFQCFSSHLLTLGFVASKADSSLFIFMDASTIIYLLIYVDDILLTGNNESRIASFIASLSRLFSMKDLGALHYFLGMEITRSSSGLHLSQSKYILDLLKKTNMVDCKPVLTPAVSGRRLSLLDGDPFPDVSQYRSVVGALQYLTLTRPDIAFAVNQVCQFMHRPTTAHWIAVKRILRYLKSTYSHGLIYRPSSLTITAFSDADYAGDPDDRKSTGGYCIYLGSNLVSWSSKKQRGVSRSSTEAEYRQLAYTAAALSWFCSLFHDLRLPFSPP